MSVTRAYRLERNSHGPPAPLRPAGAASGGQFVIVLRLDGTEDDRVVAAELLALRRAHPGHHVGLWLTDTAVPLSARRALEHITGADFAVCSAGGPRFDPIRHELLDPDRLPERAELWISARFPHLSPIARRFFTDAHDLDNVGRRVGDLAARLGVTDRTIRRHLGSTAVPADILSLGRMLGFAVHAARWLDRSLVDHAGSFGFFDYRSLARRFKRYFGRSPGVVRSIVGPADLWHAWSGALVTSRSRNVARKRDLSHQPAQAHLPCYVRCSIVVARKDCGDSNRDGAPAPCVLARKIGRSIQWRQSSGRTLMSDSDLCRPPEPLHVVQQASLALQRVTSRSERANTAHAARDSILDRWPWFERRAGGRRPLQKEGLMSAALGRWRRLAGILAAVALLIATAPAEPRAQAANCGGNDGNVCWQDEQCIWILFYKRCTTNYKYYPAGGGGGGNDPEDPPQIPEDPTLTASPVA